MKRKPFRQYALADGTSLAERPDGHFTWNPEERVVSVSIVGGIATLETTDDPPEPLGQFELANGKPAAYAGPSREQSGAIPGDEAAELPALPPGRSDGATRWDTLNAFNDEIAPHLTLSEQAVWHYLFRWCRRNRTEASIRLLSAGRRMDYKTAAAALRHIIEVGLVRVIYLSTNKHARSIYAMNPSPARCRDAAIAADADRQAKRKSRPPPPKRSRKP